MDPYLEDPTLWPDVHHELISVARELLLVQLRPKYFVQIDERLYLADDNDEARSVIIPDLRVREVHYGSARGPGMLVADPGIERAFSFEFEVRESYLRVIDRQSSNVVTDIKILSPANKVSGSAGRGSYDQKRRDIFEAHTNLVEIDLLRAGEPLGQEPGLGRTEYFAQATRFTQKEQRRQYWAMSIREPLKRISVPVREEDPDAVLDLQVMLNTAYDRAGYELRVDYRRPPVPALSQELRPWAAEVLGQIGGQTASAD
jgi:hypothetical protein